jgi:hypothetical protein
VQADYCVMGSDVLLIHTPNGLRINPDRSVPHTRGCARAGDLDIEQNRHPLLACRRCARDLHQERPALAIHSPHAGVPPNHPP